MFCSQHTPAALAAARERSRKAQAAVADGTASSELVSSQPKKRHRRLESKHLETRVRAEDIAGREGCQRLVVGSTELKPWAIDTLPVHVDIGCARGRWVLALGEADSNLAKSVNHLGIEIRGALVDEANQVATSHGVDGHVQYLAIDMAQDACSRRRLLSRWARRSRQERQFS